jgi:hypothetical protein
MILYHFTSKHHIESCKREGLTLGLIPFLSNGQIDAIDGHQWLTENLNYDQAWNSMLAVKYDRTEYRITINIPKKHHGSVLFWLDFCEENPGKFDYLNTYGDPWNWRLFVGRVKPGWFGKIDRKPKYLV